MVRFLTACFLAGAVFLPGCSGPTTVEAKGRVVSGGQPLELGPQGVLQVILVPAGMEQSVELTTFSAEVDKEQGTFEVIGGVPPGKYKFVIQALDPYPMADKLNGKFGMNNSPIVREITGEPIEIDLASP
jgi:hypothetical protein